ncbi:hypothetical protein OESDEN_10682, partial [Oesophagostomum dentatum]
LRKKLQDTVRSKINSEVPKKINEAIEQKVNPRLQKLKQKLISMGYKDYDIEWTVQNNILRAAIKPKSATKEISPVQPIDHMLCVNANVLEVISAVSSRSKRNALDKGLSFTCVNPSVKCSVPVCSMCTDVDINPAEPGSDDKFHNCL